MTEEKPRILEEFEENPASEGLFDAAVESLRAGANWAGLVRAFELRDPHVPARSRPGHWRHCVEQLEAILNKLTDSDERSDLLIETARVWEVEVGNADQALLGYQAAFRMNPGNERAGAATRRILGDAGNWLMVSRNLEQALRGRHDTGARARLLAEAAWVKRRKLGDEVAADALIAEAEALDPDVEEPESGGRTGSSWRDRVERLEAALYGTRGFDRVERLLDIAEVLVTHDPDEAEPYLAEAEQLDAASPRAATVAAALHRARGNVDAYRESLGAIASGQGAPAERAAALVALAEHHFEDGDDAATGMDALERALKLVPSHPRALDLAHRRHVATGGWRELAAVLERALEHLGRGPEETQLRTTLAELYWKQLQSLDQAEAHFRRVRLADERNRTMLRFYTEFCAEAGDWTGFLTRGRALLDIEIDPEERYRLARSMARVAEEELDDADRAIDVWTMVSADDPRARDELRRLLRAAGRWNRLVDVLKDDLAAADAEPVGTRVALLLEIAAVYREHFTLPVLAGNAYAAVLDIDPTNEEALGALAERYERAGRWSDLAALHRRYAEAEQGEAAARAWRLVGRIERERTGNLHLAAAAFEHVLEHEPKDDESFDALEEIYAVTSPTDLLRVVTERLSFASEQEAESTLRSLIDDGCGGVEVSLSRRIPLLQRLLALAPDDTRVALDLEAAYRETGRWDDLIEALERRTADATGAEQVDSVRELARLLSAQRAGVRRELDVWQRLLELAPDDVEATERVCNLLAEAGDWDELEIFAGERDEWGRLIGPLREEAERAGDAALFRRLARVFAERVGDRTGQIGALERARELDPRDIGTARELEAAYGLISNTEGRAAVLNDLVLLLDGQDARDVRWQLARLLADDLGHPEEAYEVLVPLLAESPKNDSVQDTLVALAEASGRTADLLATLKRHAATLPASPERASVYATIASLAEGPGGAPLEAADFLERLVADEPTADVVDRLVGLYERAGAWDRLAELLERTLPALDVDDRHRLAWTLVGVRAGPLGLDIDPLVALADEGVDDIDAGRLQALRETLAAHGRGAAAARVARAEVEVAGDPASSRAARLALAQALLDTDRDAAVDELVAICEDAPGSEFAIKAASTLVGRGDRGTAATRWAPAAVSVLVHHRRWDEAVGALHAAVEAGVDPDPNRREIAAIRERELRDVSGALDALLQLEDRASDDDRGWMERLARESGRLPDLVAAWRAQQGEVPSAAHLAALASILETELGELGEARVLWQRAFDLDVAAPGAADALERLNRTLADHVELAEHLIRTAEDAPRADKAARLREAGQILAALPDRVSESIPLFERALELAPRDLVASAELERVYRSTGDAASLVDLLRRKVRVHGDRPDVQAAAFRTLGDAILDGSGDPAAAFHAYRRALETVPGDPETVAALARLVTTPGVALSPGRMEEAAELVEHAYDVADDWASLLSFIEQRVDRSSSRVAAELHRKAARLLDIAADDPMRALYHWSEVVSGGSADSEAVGRCVTLGRKLGVESDIAPLLERPLADGVGDAQALRLAVVDLYIESGDTDEAVRHLEAAVIEDPRDLAALERLEHLYRAGDDPADLATILARRARTMPVAGARQALREAAELYCVVGDALREADCLVRLHRLDPDDDELSDRVEEMLTGLERWDDLAALLATRAMRVDGPVSGELRLRRARILDEHLNDTPRAVAAYRAVLDVLPDCEDALRRLAALYTVLGMTEEARQAADALETIPEAPEPERP